MPSVEAVHSLCSLSFYTQDSRDNLLKYITPPSFTSLVFCSVQVASVVVRLEFKSLHSEVSVTAFQTWFSLWPPSLVRLLNIPFWLVLTSAVLSLGLLGTVAPLRWHKKMGSDLTPLHPTTYVHTLPSSPRPSCFPGLPRHWSTSSPRSQ